MTQLDPEDAASWEQTLRQSARAQQVQASLVYALDHDPDARAQAQRVAVATGVAPDFVAANQGALEKAAKLKGFDFDAFIRNTPQTAEWFAQPENAAVAHDDLGTLQGLELAFKGLQNGPGQSDVGVGRVDQGLGFSYFPGGVMLRHGDNAVFLPSSGRWVNKNASGDFVPVGNENYNTNGFRPWSLNPFQGLSHALGMGWSATPQERELLYQMKGAPSSAVASLRGAMFGTVWGTTAGAIRLAKKALQAGDQFTDNAYSPGENLTFRDLGIPQALEGLARRADAHKAENTFQATPVTGIRGFFDGVKAAASLVGGVVPYLTPGGLSTGGRMFVDAFGRRSAALEQQDVGAAQNLALSAGAAIPDLMIGMAGHGAVPQAPNLLRNLLLQPAATGTAFLAKHFGDQVVDEALGINPIQDPNESTGEWLVRNLEAGGAESFLSGFALAAIPSLVPAVAQQMENRRNVALFRALGDTARDSKLAKRLPSAFQDLVKKVTEDGPVQNVFVEPEAVRTYFQARGVDPAAAMEGLGVRNYPEALAAGTRVVIPIEQFTAKVAPDPDLMRGIAQDMTFRQDGMTPREHQAAQLLLPTYQADLAGRADQLRQGIQADPGKQGIFEAMRQNLMDLGYESSTAESYALAHAEVMGNLAREAGRDPLALHEEYGLRVFRPRPGESVTDAILRNLEERSAQAGAGPQQEPGLPMHQGAPTPGGVGPVFTEFRGDAKGAVAKLLEVRAGEALGALTHPAIADPIDLVWGWEGTAEKNFEDGFGLAKIARKHPEVLEDLQGIISGMQVTSRTPNRVQLESPTHKAAVRLNWDDQSRTWLLTAFQKEGASGDTRTGSVPLAEGDRPSTGSESNVPPSGPEGNGASGEPMILFQSGRGDFGSKEWNEYYGLRHGSRPISDQAARARAGGRAAETKRGQAEWDAQREMELRTEEDLFRRLDEEVKQIQAGEVQRDPRGFMQVGPDRKISIGLLEKADFSTLLHELTHAHLEIMKDLAAAPGTSERLKQDYQLIREFVGAEEGDPFSVEQHEKFARAGEAYLMEGKAPSEAMQGIFARFKGWLEFVYNKLAGLNVQLSPEIRGVFDRMYASDLEIQAARERIGGEEPLFATAQDMRVTQAEYELYRMLRPQADQAAKDSLRAQVMKDFMAQQDRARRTREQEVRDQVTQDLDGRPEYQAIKMLRAGEMEDGTRLTLNKDELVRQFGEARVHDLHRLHPGLYRVEGGMDAEAAAEVLGFRSGEHLMQALEEAPKRGVVIEQETAARMKAEFGDPLTDGTIADDAIRALHNLYREREMMLELKALARRKAEVAPFMDLQRRIDEAKSTEERQQAREAWEAVKAEQARLAADTRAGARGAARIPPAEVFRVTARDLLEELPVMDINPNAYLRASRKAAREAFEAMGRDDFGQAYEAKQREVLNHFLYLEAGKGKAEAEDAYQYAGKFQAPEVRARIAKAGGDRGEEVYLAQIDGVLERFRFTRESNRSIAARQESLAQFVAARRAEGEENLVIDPSLMTSDQPRNYRELTLPELRAVRDALANLYAVAKNQLGYLKDGRRLSYEQQADLLDQSARASNKTRGVVRAGTKLTGTEAAGRWARGVDSYMQKIEWLVDQLDGGDINGPARENIKRPIDEANARRNEMGQEIFGKLETLVKARPKEDVRDVFESTGVTFPGMDRPLNRLQLVSWALNLGTEENRKVAILGEGLMNPDGSLRPEFDQALGALRKSEAEFIQGVWDTCGGMLPAIKENELRMTGLLPKLKKVTPFTIRTVDGAEVQMQGGYYPLKADPALDDVGRHQQDPAQREASGFTQPHTSTSHLHQVTGATYRLMLDYEHVLSQHLADVINRTTTGAAIDQVNRFLNFKTRVKQDGTGKDRNVFQTIQETLGEQEANEFLPWLQDFANNKRGDPNEGGPLLRFLMSRRTGMVVARLGGNLGSYMVQAGDVFKALADPDVKTSYLAKAFLDLRLNPSQHIEEIRRLSPNEMRFREQNFNREIREMLESKTVFEEHQAKLAEFLMQGFQVMDRFITFPVWLARYRQGLETHGNPEQAVREADRVIARSFQAGDARNMSRMMREGGAMKLFTTFQGDANTWYGLIGASVRSGKVSRISMGIMALIAEQIVSQAIRNRLPGEDESKAGWAAEQVLLAGLSKVPVLGDVSQYGMDKMTGKYASLQNPTFQSLEKIFASGKAIKDYAQDKRDFQEAAQDVAEAIGLWRGVPGTSQAIRIWRYVHGVQLGKEQPANPAEATLEAILGPKPKARGSR